MGYFLSLINIRSVCFTANLLLGPLELCLHAVVHHWHLLHTTLHATLISQFLPSVGGRFRATLAGMLSIWVLKWGPWRNPSKPLSPIYPLPVIPFVWPCLSRKCFRQNVHHTITDLWFLLWNHVMQYKLYLCNRSWQIRIWYTFLQCVAMM